MGATKFEQVNADFSDVAHKAALLKIYPLFFGRDFKCESTSLYKSDQYSFLDGEKKIDRLFHFEDKVNGEAITISIQERFRRPKHRKYRDITVTEFNHDSGKPSELYGIEAMYFVYGYFNPETMGFGEVVIVNTADLLRLIVDGSLSPHRNENRKNQTFLCYKIDKLISLGCVVFHSRCLNPKP
jgi:hypothetical protein